MGERRLVKLIVARRCIIQMTTFLAGIAVLVVLLFENLKHAFAYNIQINSLILACFFSGIFFVYRRVFLYDHEYSKLLSYDKLGKGEIDKLRLLAPIQIYGTGKTNLSTQSKLSSVLSSIEKRVEDCGVFPKYISGILIFLGLFGTFWGLSQTIGNVANIIDNLGIDQSDATESFAKLKDSLKIPLSGMGTAFGCSLFGLSGSLILGYLNINHRRVADDFLYKVEEWITRRTVSITALDEEGSGYHGKVFSMGLLEKTIEMIYAFQAQIREFEGNRITLLATQKEFSLKISQLTEIMAQNQDLVRTIGEGQVEIHALTKKMNETVWVELLRKLDMIDKSLTEMTQDMYNNRGYIVDNLGKDIRMITKTLSSLMRE